MKVDDLRVSNGWKINGIKSLKRGENGKKKFLSMNLVKGLEMENGLCNITLSVTANSQLQRGCRDENTYVTSQAQNFYLGGCHLECEFKSYDVVFLKGNSEKV